MVARGVRQAAHHAIGMAEVRKALGHAQALRRGARPLPRFSAAECIRLQKRH